jgi:nucleoside-diphosphate-sugar epimerase
LKLIESAEHILSKKIAYRIKNTQKNEIPSQHLNWSKIASLGWRPTFSLEMGLLETYSWYKKYMVNTV